MSAAIDIDYYEVLEIQETAGSDEIKRAFRRLSLVRHPDKDPNNPKAHVAFCTLRDAYETLSDNSKRILYNVHYVKVKARRKVFQEQQEQVRARQAQEKAKQDEAEIWRKLELENSAGNIKRFAEEKGEKERITQIQKDLILANSRLKALEEGSKARIQATNSSGLWEYLASWTKSNDQLEKEKIEREQENLQTLAKERIQTRDLERKIEQLESSKKAQQMTMQQSKKREDQRQERFRQAQAVHQAAMASAEAEAKRAAEQKRAREAAEQEKAYREMFARMQREQEERQRATQRAKEERQRAMKEAERARQKVAAEKAAREKEAKDREALLARVRAQATAQANAEKAARDAEASPRMHSVFEEHSSWEGFKCTCFPSRDPQPRKAQAAPKRKSKARPGPQESSCLHNGFWPKVEGKHRCAVCSQDFYRFVFQCPRCQIMACVSCRKELKSRS